MMKIELMPIVFAGLWASHSVAAPVHYLTPTSTAILLQTCDRNPDMSEASFCTGYIAAAFDQLSSDERICPSSAVTPNQIMAVAKKYLADHPEAWDRHPSWLLREAFKAAFPCGR